MDLATLLARVNSRQFPTVKAFQMAVALMPAAEKQYWGDDPEGVREVRLHIYGAVLGTWFVLQHSLLSSCHPAAPGQ